MSEEKAKHTYKFRECINNPNLKGRLKSLLYNNQAYQTVLYNAKKLDDDSIFKLIEPFYKKQDDASYNIHKIKYLKNVPGLNKHSQVLDFGGANGLIADAIAKEYKMSVVDVTDVHDLEYAIESDLIRYTQNTDEVLPYASNQFYLITCFMVLHHIEPNALVKIIDELYRCSYKYLLIQEHDCVGNMKYLLDILHGMYIFVYKEEDYAKMNSFSEYKAWYKSKEEFDKLLAGKFVLLNRFNTNRVQNNFVALYEKIKPNTQPIIE